MRKLQERGVIRGYRAVLDPAAVGRSFTVFVGVRLGRHSRDGLHAFQAAVRGRPEIVECHHVTGGFDYLLRVEVADVTAFEEFHAGALADLPAVAGVTSYVSMRAVPTDGLVSLDTARGG